MSEECPGREVLAELAEGTSPSQRRAAVMAHVEGCASCRTLVASALRSTATPSLGDTLPSIPVEGSIGPGLKLGPYLLVRLLGSGAMGSVYAAWDGRLEREVALKVLHREGEALLGEAKALARLSHPNVVAVHEVAAWNGRVVLAMELARGQTLRAWLGAAPRSVSEITDVFLQCAAGLEASHRAGVIHRDFKPDNALVDVTGRALLLDFGLAATAAPSEHFGLVGTPAYLAAAQLEGVPGDASADQFAWWASLFEALTGRRPFRGNTLDDLIAMQRSGVIDWSGIPRWLRRPMARGLSADPATRFASMADAAAALRRGPRTARIVGAATIAVSLALVGVFATRPTSPCRALDAQVAALVQRAPTGPLGDAALALQRGVASCESLEAEARGPRAACLVVSAEELDLALEVASSATGAAAELTPRVLRRVLPPSRCERARGPRLTPMTAAERPALLASGKGQLEFDALREAGKKEEALTLAQQLRVAADASGSPTARAWGRLNEAFAESGLAHYEATLKLLREVDSLPSLGRREETWAVIGRRLQECFFSDAHTCQALTARAQQLVEELDEPWTNAFATEVSVSVQGASLQAALSAWRAVPGADFELRRVVLAEVYAAMESDDLVRMRAAMELTKALPRPDAFLRLRLASLEGKLAAVDEDTARLDALLTEVRAIDAAAPTHHGTERALRLMLFDSRGLYAEEQAYIDAELEQASSNVDERHALLLQRMRLFLLAGDEKRWLEAQALFANLLEAHLNPRNAIMLATLRQQRALRRGDATGFRELATASELDDVLTRWRLQPPDAPVPALRPIDDAQSAGCIRIEALFATARWADALAESERLVQTSKTNTERLDVNSRRTWALWQLGRRDEACRALTPSLFGGWLNAVELRRLETVRAGCQ
jgi:Protein kinase domain